MSSTQHCSSRSRSDASSSSGRLPMDLLFDILSMLPVRPLVRFKSVSPSWRSLIEDPVFIAKHLRRSALKGRASGDHLVSIRSFDDPRSVFAISSLSGHGADSMKLVAIARPPFPARYEHEGIVDCCNGIVCGLFTQLEPDKPDEPIAPSASLYLWNPATREYRTLPRPTNRQVTHGFGYDPTADDYKVVRFTASFADVFSFRNDSWKMVEPPKYAPFYSGCELSLVRCAQLNGVLYWMARKTDSPGNPNVVVSFNLGTEEFGSFPFDLANNELLSMFDIAFLLGLPKPYYRGWLLTVYNENSLCLFGESDHDQPIGSWVREVPVPAQDQGGHGDWTWLESIGDGYARTSPLGWGFNGELYMQQFHSRRLVVHDLNTRRVIRNLPYGEYGDFICDFQGYFESLVPLMQPRN